MKDYRLKFSQVSKYTTTMVSDSRSKMNNVIGILDLIVNESRSAIMIPSLDSSHLMVNAEQIEDQNLKEVCREEEGKN